MATPKAAPAVRIAPGVIAAHPKVGSPDGWSWGPRFEGGAWIVQDKGSPPWAVRIVNDDTAKNSTPTLEWALNRALWELDHPQIVAALFEAEGSTYSRLLPRSPVAIPDLIADDIASLNDRARASLK